VKFFSAYSLFLLPTQRIRGKYSSACVERAESIQAYSENTRRVFKRIWRKGKLGLFTVHKIISEYSESIQTEIHRKNLCVPYIEKTRRDYWRIILIRHET